MTEKIRQRAKQLRESFNDCSVDEICEGLGIRIIIHKLPEGINGFFYVTPFGKAIVLDCESKLSRDYLLAHELAHALFHEELNKVFLREKTDFVLERYERQADLFAAFLLLGDTVCEESERVAAEKCLPTDVIKQWVDAIRERIAV